MLSKRIIWNQVKGRKVMHGVDPTQTRPQDINRATDIIVDECRRVVVAKSYPTFDSTWSSRKTMLKNNVHRTFNHIPKMKKITNTIFSKLAENFTIELRHTTNKGPEYTYYTSKPDKFRGDWVCVPEPDRFFAPKYYYKTLLHELSHAACSRTRLCLRFTESEEEVAVESSALIICFLSGYNLWDNCLSYITNWSYGSSKLKQQNVLQLNTKYQWDSIKRKTKRIVRYLLYGTDRF